MPFYANTAADVECLGESLPELPEPVARPCLILIGGLPGTGKSYLSRRLAERVSAVILASDALRKALIPRPVYSWEENRRLFEASHELTESLLVRGINVIFDATNLQEAHREELYQVAERAGAKLVTVWVEAPPEIVWERMVGRQKRRDPEDKSEAGWEVYRKLRGTEQLPRRSFFKVDTSRDIRPAVEKIVRAVRG